MLYFVRNNVFLLKMSVSNTSYSCVGFYRVIKVVVNPSLYCRERLSKCNYINVFSWLRCKWVLDVVITAFFPNPSFLRRRVTLRMAYSVRLLYTTLLQTPLEWRPLGFQHVKKKVYLGADSHLPPGDWSVHWCSIKVQKYR